MSWQGNILRVDLSAGTCAVEPLNMEWAGRFLGQRGLATKYLFDEMDPAVDALSPENPLIIATGPLTGTGASTGGRYSVVCKSPLTDGVACSNSGGQFGGEIKLAGYDMIIIQGRSETPVYLYVNDDEAKILPAEEYWGQSVWKVEPALRQAHGDPQLKIASIGVAGENMARYACVVNDLDRAAGRSGVGAVMGSKNLKAIAVRGTLGVQVKDPVRFKEATDAAKAKIDPTRLRRYGTLAMMDVTHNHGSLPTRNNREVQFDGVKSVNAKAVTIKRPGDNKPNLQANKACFACTIGCGRIATIDPNHFSVKDKPEYQIASGGLEYENAFAFGPMCGITDLDAMTYANFMCNEYGLDTISFGGTLSAAMELFETGAISEAETGGIALNFGSAEALVAMVDATGKGEGFGKDLALGSKRLCAKYGHPEFAMVAKGQEFPGYDGRAMQGMALAYATSNRGACHLRASPFADDFTRITPEGKAPIVKKSQDRNSVIDSIGVCSFSAGSWGMGDMAAQLDASCEGEWTGARLTEAGERIWNLERQFNLAAGLTGADDTLPERVLKDAAKSGAGKGRVAELDKMLPEYYELRGWDTDGVPTAQTLKRLGL